MRHWWFIQQPHFGILQCRWWEPSTASKPEVRVFFRVISDSYVGHRPFQQNRTSNLGRHATPMQADVSQLLSISLGDGIQIVGRDTTHHALGIVGRGDMSIPVHRDNAAAQALAEQFVLDEIRCCFLQ